MKVLPKLSLLAAALLVPLSAFGSAYDDATAGNPMYDNKEVWPNLSGKEYFLTQKFEKGRVMTWAKPGQSVGGRSGLDAWDPTNWLLDGQPATEVKFDQNTDLVLPDSETKYKLDLKRAPGWDPVYRHVTVGRNADLLHESTRYFGNIWVKKGGQLDGRHGNGFMGSGHTFVREDNGSYDEPKTGMIGQYFDLRKDSPKASVEIIGGVCVVDRVPLASGTLIIGPGSRFSPGRNASLILSKEATLVLMDNARLVKWVNQIGQLDYIFFGTVLGGLPERPLTQPAFIDLSYQNSTGIKFFDKLPAQGGSAPELEKRVTSMIVGSQAVIRSYSANPKGMLNLRWGGIDVAFWHLSSDGSDSGWVKTLTPEQHKYLVEQLAAIPKKLTAIFKRGASIDGLVLHDFHEGGLLMEDPQDFKAWKNVLVGDRNDGDGPKLVSRIARSTVLDSTKNPGGEYQRGLPEPFARQEYAEGKWARTSFVATVPAEAAGKPLGIRFSRGDGAQNWMQVDNVRMLAGGSDVIINGGFEEPADLKYKAQKGGVPISTTAPWQNMDNNTSDVRVEKAERGQYAAFYNNGTSFGQTTDYITKAGDQIEVSFDVNIIQGPIVVELFTLTK